MLVLQIYETESSAARGKCYGFGKILCTSHNRSIPSNKRIEKTSVKGTKKASLPCDAFFRNAFAQSVCKNGISAYKQPENRGLVCKWGVFAYKCNNSYPITGKTEARQAFPENQKNS
jgi:hypothetical protein